MRAISFSPFAQLLIELGFRDEEVHMFEDVCLCFENRFGEVRQPVGDPTIFVVAL
jgi:hypothetical protein